MLSIYKNERTSHTFQTEKHGGRFVITERDMWGDQPQIMGTYETRTRAQDVLDKLADEKWTGGTVGDRRGLMISFVIEGQAVPQARPRFTRFGHAYDTKKCKDYKQLVAIRAKEAMAGREPLSDACIVMIDVRVSPPESWSKVKRAAAIHSGWVTAKTGDLDNICKSVTDSLIGICYEDDCQVAGLIATKRYAEESEVIVEIIEPSRNHAPIWAAGSLRRAFHFLE